MTDLAPLLHHLERLEADIHALRVALAEQTASRAVHETASVYIAPPEIPTAHPHIVRMPGVQGGEPIVRGVIKTVRGIIELTRLGQTPQTIVDEFGDGLTLAQVYDALSYYYDNQDEMEQILADHQAALEEGRRWMREREQTRPKS